MSHHFFQFTPKNRDFRTRVGLSKELENIAFQKLSPFYKFLKTALKVIESKESIKASWKKIQRNRITLKPIGFLYTVSPETTFDLINTPSWYWVEGISRIDYINYKEPIKIIFGGTRKDFTITQNDLVRFGNKALVYLNNITETTFDKVIWDMDNLTLEPAWLAVNNMQNALVAFAKNEYPIIKIHFFEKITISSDFSQLANEEPLVLTLMSQNQATKIRVKGLSLSQKLPENCTFLPHFEADSTKKLIHSYDSLPLGGTTSFEEYIKIEDILNEMSNWVGENSQKFIFTSETPCEQSEIKIKNIPFAIQNIIEPDKDCWIQLEETESTHEQEEESASSSPLHCFFEDEIEIEDETGEKYSIVEGDNSQFKLRLKNNKANCYPKGKFLSVKINTYQIKMQLRAISNLQTKPIGTHINLLNLFKEKTTHQSIWSNPSTLTLAPNDWIVLTDEHRSGASEQRNFVKKALNSPDFSILEGPPGSGKTTVILELICQLIKSGKRVLLCGSTHVAVDNVLEKLDAQQPNGTSLIQQLNILPIRIGDKHKIGEKVSGFQLENCVNSSGIGENLLLDAANLVCGTTIGILQHPQFKQRDITTPILPTFDYLIVDESSKTTFQEFLVPALYAQKWVLVGDVMQLAPFSDRAQLVSNIQNLPIPASSSPFPLNQQKVLFYLQKIEDIFKNKPTNCYLAFAFTQEELNFIAKELAAKQNNYEYLIHPNNSTISCLEYFGYQVVFFDINNTENIIGLLPETFRLFSVKEGVLKNSAFAFRQFYLFDVKKLNISAPTQKNESASNDWKELTKYFTTRSWADEIAWRIDRKHQLRLKQTAQANYNPKYLALDSFLPQSIANKKEIEQSIRTVEHIALPSILECLIKGLSHNDTSTTIAEGFEQQELSERHVILKYQHRMHPDISQFPRTQFYHADALLDAQTPKTMFQMRDWNYTRYRSRNIWIDINDGRTQYNRNEKEVMRVMQELKHFLEFARESTQAWTVACLTFYRGQERLMRDELRKLCGQSNNISLFRKDGVVIQLHTVDKFQGQEADIVFLSMVQTQRNGFLDSPNRLNVALTRAKYQLVIVGKHDYFKEQRPSEDLKKLAESCVKIKKTSVS